MRLTWALAGLIFTNHGTMTAADEGIEATDNATFANTGLIRAGDDAIQTDDNASITNPGTIRTTENDAIDIDTGRVINAGTITGTSGIVNDIADFGAGADTLPLSGTRAAAAVGGGLFDGGDDADTALFDVSVGALISFLALPGLGDVFTLKFVNADATFCSVTLGNFETFAFRDAVLDRAGLAAAVPRPASALMLGAAIGALSLARRCR